MRLSFCTCKKHSRESKDPLSFNRLNEMQLKTKFSVSKNYFLWSTNVSIDCAKDLSFMGSCRSKWSLVVWFKLWDVQFWKKKIYIFYSHLVFWKSFSLIPFIHFYKYIMLLFHSSNFITFCQGRRAHFRLWVTLSVRNKRVWGSGMFSSGQRQERVEFTNEYI